MFALKQIAEFSLCLLDKIFNVPSEWINAISPLIIWFTLHTEDGLIQSLFDNCPTLIQELSRLHTLVSKNIEDQYIALKLKNDEESQLKIF
jgi:hypothetical protein